MIRRFVYLLLVALMLANQGFTVAHSHHGTDVAEPESHASRRHFHLGGHTHHEASHADGHLAAHSHTQQSDCNLPPAMMPLGDHDADAVYFAATVTLARGGTTPIIVPAKLIALAAILGVAEQSNDRLPHLGPIRGQPSSDFDTACPIYLRTLSLRI
jgi:hypothetical protein